MSIEYCSECEEPTGNAGRMDGSIFVLFPDSEVGPICHECSRKLWVCDKCEEGVYSENVLDDGTHKGCGGIKQEDL